MEKLTILLAKHKKKKPDFNSEPKDSINNETPEVSSDSGIPETESKVVDSSDKEDKLNKLFWIRVGLGVLGGIAATFLFESITGEERRWASIGFLIILFIVTIIIGKGMKIPLPSSDRKKLFTQGIGSFIFIYLFMWILTYTLTHITSATQIPSPIP